MLKLPKSTEVNKFLSKEKLTEKLTLTASLKESLKNDVKKFTIINELSPKSMNIVKGTEVSAIFVMEVLLKQQQLDYKLIEAIARQNPNKLLFVLRYEDYVQLAVFYNKLYHSEWCLMENINLELHGDSFDTVWSNIIAQIALVKPIGIAADIEQELEKQTIHNKLIKEIARLEKQARSEQQPRRKFEIVGRIGGLKTQLRGK